MLAFLNELHVVSFHLLHFGAQKDVLCQEGIVSLSHEKVPFCYSLMFKKFLSLPNHRTRVCFKEKELIVELDMD